MRSRQVHVHDRQLLAHILATAEMTYGCSVVLLWIASLVFVIPCGESAKGIDSDIDAEPFSLKTEEMT